jgi:serine phosphatase RsbU (regulator of sigma subunit)/predicted ester cyclase
MKMYAEDAVVKSPLFHTIRGRTAIGRTFEALYKVWPDNLVHSKESLLICEGNRAAEFSTISATDTTGLLGFPPTGEKVQYDGVKLYAFRGGLIVNERRLYDLVGIVERLGKSRLDQELAVAADIQRILLPRTRHVGRFFEAIGVSVPSRAIGGDFFEYLDLPSGDFGLAIGDVAGKGPAAALVGAMAQGILSVEAEKVRSPSATLTRTNCALRRRGLAPRFVTMVYGVLSPDGCFRYSNAGHNPPLLLTETGSRRLTTGGVVMGLFDDATYGEETVELAPGDVLVMFSDGVTEARNAAGEEFTDARLQACVEAHRYHTPRTILNALVECVRSFCGDAVQSDDLTTVVLRFQ